MPLAYLTQRIVRNLLPGPVASLGRRLFGGIPGGETHAPEFFAGCYVDSLARVGRSFDGAEVLVFGHGPSFGFACELLAAGARRIFLFDPYAEPDHRLNARWLERYPDYLEGRDGEVVPRSEWMTLVEAAPDPVTTRLPRTDITLSTSVFEHLDDVEEWTGKLARSIRPDGINLHWIDLRDHFFHRPFEMLCYSRRTWQRWLNPRQNLNRWRRPDYERVFRRHFAEVSTRVLNRDREGLEKMRPRIRPEFLTGDPEVDSSLEIEISATAPRV